MTPIRLTIASLAVALSLTLAASAQAYVYWGDPHAGTIGRANNDGSDATDSFIDAGGEPFAIAVDAGHIYWANKATASIGRANIDGSDVEPNFITGAGEPTGVAVTSSYIFWSDMKNDKIGRANLDGTGKLPSLIATEASPCGVAVDSGSVYWPQFDLGLNEARIGRAAFNGSSVKSNLAELGAPYLICGVAVNSANVFWASTGFVNGTQIGRANVSNGQAVNPSLIGDATGPCGIAVFGTQLFWANGGNGTIGRANTDGTAVDEEAIHTGGGQICGVAVDTLSSPLTPPSEPSPSPTTPSTPSSPSSPAPTSPTAPSPAPKSPSVRIVGHKLDKKKGTAQVSVAVSGAGLVSLQGKGIVAAVVKTHGAETVSLPVRVVKKKVSTLRRAGHLKAKLSISFAPSAGGGVGIASTSLTLIEKQAAPKP